MRISTCSSLKIGHVLRRFVPSQWGGIESAVFHLSHALQKQGISSPIFTTDMLSHRGCEQFGGVPVHRYGYSFPWFGLDESAHEQMVLKGGNPLSVGLIRGLLTEPGLSLIHAHTTHRLGGAARTVARLRRIPYVVSVHGGHFTLPDELSDQMRRPFEGKWEWGKVFGWMLGARRVLDDAHAIICVGSDEFAAMKSAYPDKRVELIPSGVHVEHFAAANGQLFRHTQGLSKDVPIVLCISRIDPQKNQLLLIETFAQFRKNHPEHKLVLIGPVTVPSYHTLLTSTVNALGLSKDVIIIPGLNQEDPILRSALAAAQMFVLPSSHEPFGIVILEAWAAGIPCVATQIGGISGFVRDGETALMFPDKRSDSLLSCMEKLAGQPELRARLSTAGLREVQQYDWQAQTRRMTALYSSIIGEKACA